jgi:hypothetical protein
MLRLWRVDDQEGAVDAEKPAWRASLEDPHTGERMGFARLEALFDFLQRLTSVGTDLESTQNNHREGMEASVIEKKAMVRFGKAFDRATEIIEQQGGTVLANYGQAVLVRISDSGLQALCDAGYRVRELPERPKARIAGFELDTTVPSGLSTSAAAAEVELPSGRSHHIVRLVGPMHHDWKERLERMGVVFAQSMGEDQYLVSVDSAEVDDVQALTFVEAVSPYFPAMKISPTLLTPELQTTLSAVEALSPAAPEMPPGAPDAEEPGGPRGLTGAPPASLADAARVGNLEVVLFEGEDPLTAVDAVRALGANVIRSGGQRIIVYADLALVPQIATFVGTNNQVRRDPFIETQETLIFV